VREDPKIDIMFFKFYLFLLYIFNDRKIYKISVIPMLLSLLSDGRTIPDR